MIEPLDLMIIEAFPALAESSSRVVFPTPIQPEKSPIGVPTQAPGDPAIHCTSDIGPSANSPATRLSTLMVLPRSQESRYSGKSRNSLMRSSPVTVLLSMVSSMSCRPATLRKASSPI